MGLWRHQALHRRLLCWLVRTFKKISPILKELAGEYKNDIIIYKINVDNEKELAAAFGIQSIPTLLFIPAKGKPQLAQGALSKEQFVEQINGFLLGKK